MNLSFLFPSILYFGHGSSITEQEHSHPFHQLEICTAGHFFGIGEDGKIRDLVPNSFWMIPPGMMHKFRPSPVPAEYFTIKFQFPVSLSFESATDEVTGCLIENLIRILRGGSSAPGPYSAAGKELLEGVLYQLLHHGISRAGEKKRSLFQTELVEWICSRGYESSGKDLSERFGMPQSTLKYRFRQEMPEEKGLKSFIDRTLADQVRNHLEYSDMTLSRISETLHFPNIYVFSRFCRRMLGVCPREYRKNILEKNHFPS